MAAGKSAGNAPKRWSKALIPPAEAAITTTGKASAAARRGETGAAGCAWRCPLPLPKSKAAGMARGRVFVLLVSLLRVIIPYKGCRRSLHFSSSFILTPTGAKAVKIVPPVVKTRPLDVPLPLMHAPLPCAILVSPSLPQDQQHVRDSVRVLHTAEHVGCPAEDMRSGRSAPFILPAGTGLSPDVVHLIGCRR